MGDSEPVEGTGIWESPESAVMEQEVVKLSKWQFSVSNVIIPNNFIFNFLKISTNAAEQD